MTKDNGVPAPTAAGFLPFAVRPSMRSSAGAQRLHVCRVGLVFLVVVCFGVRAQPRSYHTYPALLCVAGRYVGATNSGGRRGFQSVSDDGQTVIQGGKKKKKTANDFCPSDIKTCDLCWCVGVCFTPVSFASCFMSATPPSPVCLVGENRTCSGPAL